MAKEVLGSGVTSTAREWYRDCHRRDGGLSATRHMTRTHHTGTVPGAAGGYAQACKRRKYGTRLQPFVVETGGRVHRDTLQFVHDKLANAPVGVEAREKKSAAIGRIYARIAECLEQHAPHQVDGKFDQGARAAAA